MRIGSLKISNLRNHSCSSTEFADGLNIIHGLNGSGKTTLLEAISIGALTKTFLPTQDAAMIRHGEYSYFVGLDAVNDLSMDYWVKIGYERGKRKSISSKYGENQTPKDVIGELPVVVLTPDFKPITFGAPQDRRSFIDRLLSQLSKKYISDMMDLKKCLRQRNSLLNDAKKYRSYDEDLIKSWTQVLVTAGSEIIYKRKKFIHEFTPIFREYYHKVTGGKEEVNLNYLPDSLGQQELSKLNLDDIRDILSETAKSREQEELRRGTTVFGPQKDELLISLNGAAARDTASQGQHKSLLIALKFAEFIYLQEIRNETPVILLDDIFSELDERRKAFTLQLILDNNAQTFITTTNSSEIILDGFAVNPKYIFVDGGQIYQEK